MDHSFVSLSSDEIQSALEKASLFGGMISYPTSSRNEIIKISRIDVDKQGKISLRTTGEINMKEKWPVSIRLNYRDITFQIDPKFYTIHGNVITAHLPLKARALKARHDKRYVLPYLSEIKTSMYRIEKRSGNLELNLKILDVSKSGLAVLIQDLKEDNILLKNDHLWIKSINGQVLEQPLFATVVYTSPRKYKDTTDLKVGLELQERLPGPVMRELQALSSLVLTA